MRRGGLDYLGVINAVRMGDEGGGEGGKRRREKSLRPAVGTKGRGSKPAISQCDDLILGLGFTAF